MSSTDVRSALVLALDELAEDVDHAGHREANERFYRGEGEGVNIYIPTPDLEQDGVMFTITSEAMDAEGYRIHRNGHREVEG